MTRRDESTQQSTVQLPAPPPTPTPAPASAPPPTAAPAASTSAPTSVVDSSRRVRARRAASHAPTPGVVSPGDVPGRARRRAARDLRNAYEQLGLMNGISEAEMIAQVMAESAAMESAPVTDPSEHTPTPTPEPAPAPTPVPAPAPTPDPTTLCGCLVCQVGGAPGPRQQWTTTVPGFLAPDSTVPWVGFVGPLPPWMQRRVDAARQLRHGQKRTRSTTGSGSSSGSTQPQKGWLGSIISLQARIRGVKARLRHTTSGGGLVSSAECCGDESTESTPSDGPEPEQPIHRPATLHVRRDGTWLCSVVGCCRPSGRMAHFADGTMALVCCELCLGGVSHTEECEGSSSLWQRRQQRQQKRTRSTAGSGSASGCALPSKGWLGSIIEFRGSSAVCVDQRNGVRSEQGKGFSGPQPPRHTQITRTE